MKQYFLYFLLCGYFVNGIQLNDHRQLSKRALQKSHEKSQSEKWQESFFGINLKFDQTTSLVNLINKITIEYLNGCTSVILYDNFTESSDDLILGRLLINFPISYVHGQITDENQIKIPKLIQSKTNCMNYILFMKDVMKCRSVIGEQNFNKVIVIARSSQWRVYEFLSSEFSQSFTNLLVIAKSEKIASIQEELPYILYTHKLFIDGLGSSTHQILTSWSQGKLTRPHILLFPKKIVDGFSGHRFIISLAHQPPFVIKKGRDDNDDVQWDGIEYRLVELLAKIFNFTTDFKEVKDTDLIGSVEAVTKVVQDKKANLGIAGLYVTEDRIQKTDTSILHYQDCATFISLTSTALPRYRAIMGPFHWTVWLALTGIYLFAVFPLAFSYKHTLRHLIEKPEEMENMFWYVFGTFTNSFTFLGRGSWSNSDKMATRLLIGFYWLFTIIITACYTGSIIAFVTLPVYPKTIDTPQQLLDGRFQIGTLDKGGWEYWFENMTDPISTRLFKKVDLVPDIESGIKNTTKAFFWPYAFLGSRAQLDYIVRTNFTTQNKRSLLHIGSKCFIPFSVSLIYKKNSIYSRILDIGILNIVESGLQSKIKSDVEWDMMRSATGKLLAANSYGNILAKLVVEDRALTLDDTQGMFLLLGAGFILGGISLLTEWFGGCLHLCSRRRKNSLNSSLASNYRSHNSLTPRQKLDSVQYNQPENEQELQNVLDILENRSNNVDCIVHADKNNCLNTNNNSDSDSDYEQVINKLFNFDELFGEENNEEQGNNNEILDEDN